jgi:hypothetical protein
MFFFTVCSLLFVITSLEMITALMFSTLALFKFVIKVGYDF